MDSIDSSLGCVISRMFLPLFQQICSFQIRCNGFPVVTRVSANTITCKVVLRIGELNIRVKEKLKKT